MTVRYMAMLFFGCMIMACGDGPTQNALPQEPVLETPLVVLPAEFRAAKIYEVVTDSLVGVPSGRFYPDFVKAQRFSYDNQFISGHIIDYGSPIEVMIQHDKALGSESDIRIGTDSSLMDQFNPRLSIDQSGQPTLYFIAGQYAIHVTIRPDLDNPETARFFVVQFAEDVIELNHEVMTPPPYFVQLGFAAPPEPQFNSEVSKGNDLIMNIVLNYSLLDADDGQITYTLERDVPFLSRTKVVNVVRGLGTVSFADTLQYSSDIPDSGATVTVQFVLTPPYIDDTFLTRYTVGEDIGGGLYRHTAQIEIPYRLK